MFWVAVCDGKLAVTWKKMPCPEHGVVKSDTTKAFHRVLPDIADSHHVPNSDPVLMAGGPWLQI